MKTFILRPAMPRNIFLCLLFFCHIPAATLLAQNPCEQELAEAEDNYFSGQLDEAIVLVTNCIQRGKLTRDHRIQAYRILTQAYLAKEFNSQAKEAMKDLLRRVPEYEPDPVTDLPAYIRLVAEAREELSREPPVVEATQQAQPVQKGGGKRWWLIGAGTAVVAGGVVFLISSGSDAGSGASEGIPDPPGRPNRP